MSDPVRMVVNGQPVEAAADDADMNLIDFLHERQDLTGTKLCCGIGVCRACTVGVRNTPDAPMEKTLSCSTPVSAMAGMHVHDRRPRRTARCRRCSRAFSNRSRSSAATARRDS